MPDRGTPVTRAPADPPEVRIDRENEWVWCGDRRLELTPKAYAVLRYLADRAGRLVTKDELLGDVWRDAIVSDAALASCIRDLRRALTDSPSEPRYIETVHRRGFRFIGPLAPQGVALAAPPAGAEPPWRASPAAPTLVGRDAELARLRDLLGRALSGRRQLVFVTGEPGIGKTALVDAFVERAGLEAALYIGRGQCVEQYGAGEPYLPVLEALGRLGRSARDDRLLEMLKRHAPTWLAQLPALLSDAELEGVQRRAQAATRDRMLRELVEGLDALSAERPVVLVLEDLHWSDSATVDLLGMLARRREASRLLVLGTYRPAEVVGAAHPLRSVKQELQLHGHCQEMALDFLTVSAVEQYLHQRFPRHRLPVELARVLHRTTDGNPLFLVNTIDYLVGRGQLREVDGEWAVASSVDDIASRTPETLWKMVERQVDRLSGDEQAMLAVGSVAGAEFSTAVAIADGIDPEEGELRCQALARRGQFLRSAGVAEWPDGTVAGRYAFIHALYQQVLYARVSIGTRPGLHLRTGQRLERGYAERATEIAGELAMHFAHGRDFGRAAWYRRRAGEHALGKHAYREAAEHATQALALLQVLPESAVRTEQELALQVMLGASLTATHGFGALEVARAYARARELCEHVGDTAGLVPVLVGLGRFHQGRGELEIAHGLADRLAAIAETTGDEAVGLAAENALGIMAFYEGELDDALAHLERGAALYDPEKYSPNRSAAFRAGQDPGVACGVYAAWALQLLGHPDRAAARMRDALALARSLDHPLSLVYACHFAAGFHLCRRERDTARELEDQALAHSAEHGYGLFATMGMVHRGRVIAEHGPGADGLAQIRDGMAALRAIGIEFRRPLFLSLLAEACEVLRQPAEGLSAVTEALALAAQTGQRHWDAELHRQRGALMLQSEGDVPARRAAVARDADACFAEALAVARRQKARLFELRAATSASRLLADHGKRAEARASLSAVYGQFTEGFDTADLREARQVLEALAARAGAARDRTARSPRPPGSDGS